MQFYNRIVANPEGTDEATSLGHERTLDAGRSLVHVPELVALALPPSRLFVESIEAVWSRGDAFAPIDPRLPDETRRQVMAALAPTRLRRLDDTGHLVEIELPDGQSVEEGDAVVVATSGTSGQPKAVIHTHASVQASARATSRALDVDPAADTWLACLPPAHIGGLSVVLRALITGTGLTVHDRFDPAKTTQAATDGATLVSLVTRTLTQIDPNIFRRILIGGASPPEHLPDNVWSTYGMTETGSGIVYNTSEGQVVLDGCEVRTIPGPAGDELQVRGPMLFRGYRQQTASPFTSDGWFPTGDLGEVKADGGLAVHGRRGDVIVTGGEKVWPDPVERLLRRHPGVQEAAVVGLPDPEWGHQVVAVIVPTPDDSAPRLDELRTMVKAELPAWCAPKQLELRQLLPKTSIGKIRRATLAAELAAADSSAIDSVAGDGSTD